MFTSHWFENEEARYASCLEAVCGFYCVAPHEIINRGKSEIRRVFMKMLILCCVSEETICGKTGVSRHEVRTWMESVKVLGTLRQKDRQIVAILMRHLATSANIDSELPPKFRDSDSDLNVYEKELENLRRARQQLSYCFWDTPVGQRHLRKYPQCGSFATSSKYEIVTWKRPGFERGDRELWLENRQNDALVLRCMATIAQPIDWSTHTRSKKSFDHCGRIVFLVAGYQLAFGLTDQETDRFETDGRVVLIEGNSCYARSRPTRCLLFMTADDAKGFVNPHVH